MSDNICLPQTHLIIIICVFMGLCLWYIDYEKKNHIKYHILLKKKINPVINPVNNPVINPVNNPVINPVNNPIINPIINPVINPVNNPVINPVINPVNNSVNNPVVNPVNNPVVINENQRLSNSLNKYVHETRNFPIIDSELQKRILLLNRDRDILLNDFAPPERRIPAYAYPNRYVKTLLNIPTRGDPDSYQLLGIVLRNNTETAYNLFGRQSYPGSNQYEYYVQASMNDNLVKIPISIKGDKEIEDDQIIDIPGTNQTMGSFRVKLYKLDVPRYNPRMFN